MTLNISTNAATAHAAGIAADLGPRPTVEIRTGPKPAAVESPDSGLLLGVVPLPGGFTLEPASPRGVRLSAADPGPVKMLAGGYAQHFRLKSSDGVPVLDGDVTGPGGRGDMTLSSTHCFSGDMIDLCEPAVLFPLSGPVPPVAAREPGRRLGWWWVFLAWAPIYLAVDTLFDLFG